MTRKAKSIKIRVAVGALALSGLFAGLAQVFAQGAPGGDRLALVVGEAAYRAGPLASAANDAGLIAQTLQTAGFDVTGAADLDQDALRKTLRDFIDKAASAGPGATVFIYLAGRGVQYEGENYFAPVDAVVASPANVPLEMVRLSDYLGPLAQTPLRARIVVLDAARAGAAVAQLAGGLALVDPPNGELIAFNAAPGSVAPPENGPYGVYARALDEMMRRGGLPIDQVFDNVRLRVAEQTRGAQIPWDESRLSAAPALFAGAGNAPPMATADLRTRPIRDYSVDQAYAAALERDSIAGYSDYLTAYPNSPYAARVRGLLAVRREALTWRRVWSGNTPEAYWTYLQRYPRGPHAEDARRRLAILRAELTPPPRFVEYAFDVPPPPDWEEREDNVYFRGPYVEFGDADYGPPPPRIEFLPPPVFYDAPPPPPPPHSNLLPLPLAAAPLLFAIPAIRHGLFHAPAPILTQNPDAQKYYDERARPAAPQPGAQPRPPGAPPPAAPGAAQQLAPQHPGAPAQPRGGANGQAPQGAPSGRPLPTPPVGQAPQVAPQPPGGPTHHNREIAPTAPAQQPAAPTHPASAQPAPSNRETPAHQGGPAAQPQASAPHVTPAQPAPPAHEGPRPAPHAAPPAAHEAPHAPPPHAAPPPHPAPAHPEPHHEHEPPQ